MPDEEGFTVPVPSEVIITLVAEPPKVFPVTVTADKPQVLPVMLPSVTTGGLIHPHETVKGDPVDIHPAIFLTVK
jgi:hypothetical protein